MCLAAPNPAMSQHPHPHCTGWHTTLTQSHSCSGCTQEASAAQTWDHQALALGTWCSAGCSVCWVFHLPRIIKTQIENLASQGWVFSLFLLPFFFFPFPLRTQMSLPVKTGLATSVEIPGQHQLKRHGPCQNANQLWSRDERLIWLQYYLLS